MPDADIVIVGAGLAGLCCARHLHAAGRRPLLLELETRVGGRVRTDRVDGFLLDHGFQVLLTSYPEAQAMLDLPKLDLRSFFPGAMVRRDGRFRMLADPWRRPLHALRSALAPLVSLADVRRVQRMRRKACALPADEIWNDPECSTLDALQERGFSQRMIESFFRPWCGGIFLERELQTSSRMLNWVFQMFARGDAALPADGMEAIPRQLAAGLPQELVRTGVRVASARADGVTLEDGTRIAARAVVAATDAATLSAADRPVRWRGVTCLYFAADSAPLRQPVLVLNGEGDEPINNLCVLSQVAPSYAPPGRALISVTVLGCPPDGHALERDVRSQLREWFGDVAARWRLLRTYAIPRALPDQSPPTARVAERPVRLASGVYVAGDHADIASIQGAMASGRRAAQAVLRDLKPQA